jgi:pimeloyl-ACP methyl ester carboxylesterase
MEPEPHQVQSADGTRITYWCSGQGRPLLLVHGAGGDHHQWDAMRPSLDPHVTVVGIDRRSSVGDPAARYSLEREFEDIAAIAATFAGPVDLMGWSSGAICALHAALRLPNLRRLVLGEPPWLYDHMPAVSATLDRLLAAGELDGVLETFLREGVRVPEAGIAALKASPEWPGMVQRSRRYPREVAALIGWPFEALSFRALHQPVCFLVGGETPPNHHHRGYIARLAAVLPDFRVVELPGQDHFAPLRAPALVAEAVVTFLVAATG